MAWVEIVVVEIVRLDAAAVPEIYQKLVVTLWYVQKCICIGNDDVRFGKDLIRIRSIIYRTSYSTFQQRKIPVLFLDYPSRIEISVFRYILLQRMGIACKIRL